MRWVQTGLHLTMLVNSLIHRKNLPFPTRVDQDAKFDDGRCESNMSLRYAEVTMPHSRAQVLQIVNCN